jgi:ankyrin repeat protein
VPTDSLPANPNLEQLKANAKSLRDLVREGADGAIDLVREHHPRLGDLAAGSPEATGFKLAYAQLTLARHYGFPSWPKLRAQVELLHGLTRFPHRQPVGETVTDDVQRADELVRLACLNYGADDPARPRQARALLRSHPHIARASIYTMAAVGDVAAAAAQLAADPAAAGRQGGPFAWEPLLYACYSRVDLDDEGYDTLEVARLLLAAGADPNVGYLWEGYVPPFTALTGAFGGGEGHQPPHCQSLALARLLLEAGADPNDSQTIYNRGLGDIAADDTEYLELLFDFGLGTGDGGPWYRMLAPAQPTPAELIAEALQHAAEAALPNRARLLLRRGADPNARGQHPCFGGRTPYETAVLHGNIDIALMLAETGADTATVDPVSAFVGACMAGDRAAVDRVLAGDPSLVHQALEREPDLLRRAAELGRGPAVSLLVDLGYDVNARHRTTALHEAALRGDLDLVRLLVDLGADPTIEDTEHHSTPEGWANYSGQTETAAYLAEHMARRPPR